MSGTNCTCTHLDFTIHRCLRDLWWWHMHRSIHQDLSNSRRTLGSQRPSLQWTWFLLCLLQQCGSRVAWEGSGMSIWFNVITMPPSLPVNYSMDTSINARQRTSPEVRLSLLRIWFLRMLKVYTLQRQLKQSHMFCPWITTVTPEVLESHVLPSSAAQVDTMRRQCFRLYNYGLHSVVLLVLPADQPFSLPLLEPQLVLFAYSWHRHPRRKDPVHNPFCAVVFPVSTYLLISYYCLYVIVLLPLRFGMVRYCACSVWLHVLGNWLLLSALARHCGNLACSASVLWNGEKSNYSYVPF